jgi:Xaa-Pro aminopeptidase
MLVEKIAAIQESLKNKALDGWFFSCFQKNDPVSLELLGLANKMVSRRCYYFIPAQGEPRKLVHLLEPAMLDHLPGEKSGYLTWQQHSAKLAELTEGNKKIAAQYSPGNELPSNSRLDAGTAEVLKNLGLDLISSADLVQQFAAVWTMDQLEGHRRSCQLLHEIVKEAFAMVATKLRAGAEIDEYSVQQFIMESFDRGGLYTEAPPIVGVNANSADPHYQPSADLTAPIKQGDFLLIDLWAKGRSSESVYADICWCGVCAAEPTARQQEVFEAVSTARDAGLHLIKERYPTRPVSGYEVDNATRQVIEAAGFGEQFIHRTGHSIGIEDHGQGANMDDFETHDTRQLIAMTGFSIEPGIYFPGDFGIRSEINVVLTETEVEVTGGEPQRELLKILA